MTSAATPADQQTIRRHNLGLVVATVSQLPGSRAELAQRTGLTKATVSSLVDSLLLQGILVEGEPLPARVGRPARPVGLNPDGPWALGAEINVDYLSICLLDLTGRVRAHRQLPVDNRDREPARMVDDLIRLCSRELTGVGAGSGAGTLLGAALAVPGVVGADRLLVRAPNLPGLTGYRLAEEFSRRLGVDALIENEANLGALGWSRTEPGQPDFVYVSGEVGVGAGLVVDGTLFRGVAGFAGELGHVVVERDGPRCGCGGRGCVEQYAGQDVLLRSSGQPDAAALATAVAAGEPAAVAAVTAAGAALGVGLASLLNVMNLPTVVLGGLYARLFDQLTPSLRAELDCRVLSSGAEVILCRSTLGSDAAVRGAAGAVLDRALRDPGALAAS